MSPRSLAFIPARGGSKGLLLKNIRPLGGRPLIEWTIADALDSPWIERVVVSTDHPEIARIARAAGAEVPFLRPPHLSTDAAPLSEVSRHLLEWLRDHEGYAPEVLTHFSATYPFRSRALIEDVLGPVCRNEADFAITVRERRIGPETFVLLDGPAIRPCFTHPRKAWETTGSIGVCAPRRGYARKLFVPVRERLHLIDIDTEQDLAEAERALAVEPA